MAEVEVPVESLVGVLLMLHLKLKNGPKGAFRLPATQRVASDVLGKERAGGIRGHWRGCSLKVNHVPLRLKQGTEGSPVWKQWDVSTASALHWGK